MPRHVLLVEEIESLVEVPLATQKVMTDHGAGLISVLLQNLGQGDEATVELVGLGFDAH